MKRMMLEIIPPEGVYEDPAAEAVQMLTGVEGFGQCAKGPEGKKISDFDPRIDPRVSGHIVEIRTTLEGQTLIDTLCSKLRPIRVEGVVELGLVEE